RRPPHRMAGQGARGGWSAGGPAAEAVAAGALARAVRAAVQESCVLLVLHAIGQLLLELWRRLRGSLGAAGLALRGPGGAAPQALPAAARPQAQPQTSQCCPPFAVGVPDAADAGVLASLHG
ncbi:unnamed protein product, partial [Prorocentrum cordatum]